MRVADRASQTRSMASVLSGIQSLASESGAIKTDALSGSGVSISQSSDFWLAQGRRTIAAGEGVCTDLAAAAVILNDCVNRTSYEASIEIVSSGTHAFVITNRAGEVRDVNSWGNETLVTDLWYANQFTQHSVVPIFWFQGPEPHYMRDFIVDNESRLRVDANIRGVIGSLFD